MVWKGVRRRPVAILPANGPGAAYPYGPSGGGVSAYADTTNVEVWITNPTFATYTTMVRE